MRIAVNNNNFENFVFECTEESDSEKILDEFENYTDYEAAKDKLLKQKIIEVDSEKIQFGLIHISYCIKQGSRGDCDGFGVEPDTWISAYLDRHGKFLSPLSLSTSKTSREIRKKINSGINPFQNEQKQI